MPPRINPAETMSLVTEYFEREDDRFVETLRELMIPNLLTPFVERWKRDARPWARRQIVEYLQLPMNVPGHHVVVKRLYKQAEANADDELVGNFLVAFDRLIRRVRATRWEYEWNPQTRRSIPHRRERLVAVPNSIPPTVRRDPVTGKRIQLRTGLPRHVPALRLFSVRTRGYLQRRVWRYFRRLAAQRPTQYVAAATDALWRFLDEDLMRPENLLDSRGLMRICFGMHSALDFDGPSVKLRPNRTFAELTAAPRFEPLWREESAGGSLLKLLIEAASRTVRIWAKQMLERHHPRLLEALPVETVFRLLDHSDAELQQFGATLLETLAGVDGWPLETWLRLLELRDPTALAIVCEQLVRRVAGERLSVGQTLDLATARATPVARIGLTFLRGRKWDSADDRRALVAIGAARCDAVAADLAKWTLGIAGSGDRYERDVVSALFDSLSEQMRNTTKTWFAGSSEAQDDPVLWSRLLETPYDEVRLGLVEQLQRRVSRPRIDGRDLSSLWAPVLLGVHRGGRQKLKAVEQLVDAVVEHPAYAPTLVPVLGTAIRSIREPERRAGLAGAARLADRHPDLVGLLRQTLPELTLTTPNG